MLPNGGKWGGVSWHGNGQDGRVTDAVVQTSSDPIFERPALAAVRKWKFEPGRRDGRPARFRMRVPVTFPGERRP